jgi:hypothetical protein
MGSQLWLLFRSLTFLSTNLIVSNQGCLMMTTEKSPESTSKDHPDDRREVIAHLFDKWALFHIDTTALTGEEATEDIKQAHEDLHRDDK